MKSGIVSSKDLFDKKKNPTLRFDAEFTLKLSKEKKKLVRYSDKFDGERHERFLCDFCNKQFKDDSSYRKHLYKKHEKTPNVLKKHKGKQN